MKHNNTAVVFQECDGFHWCPSQLPHLDARGRAHVTRNEAIRAAYRAGFSHVITEGFRRRKIAGIIALDSFDHAEHSRIQEVLL